MAACIIRSLATPGYCVVKLGKTPFVCGATILQHCRKHSSKVYVPGSGRHHKHFLREMYKRRLDIGPDKLRKRSDWINWNYDCELFSFGKRLGEEFNEANLGRAFIHRSYIEEEKRKRAELGMSTEFIPLDLEDNAELAKKGEGLISSYIKTYLRNVYPNMFEECISSIHEYLLKDDLLSNIASHLGCEELILSQEFPVLPKTLSETFKAVVGVLQEDSGQDCAEKFILDFVLRELIGKDINDLWPVVNPMGLLVALLALAGRQAPESRLLWKSGTSTVLSLYWIGIYSNRQLIAKAPGESVEIAEDMAAQEAIKKIMGIEGNRSPMVFGSQANDLHMDRQRINSEAEDILRQHYTTTQSNERLST